MKRISLLAFFCCLFCLCALTGLAQEETLPVIRITYAADAVLSQADAVDAQVTLVSAGTETSFPARLRLNDKTLDVVECALPQQSLRVDGDDQRFILYNDGNDALYTKIISAVCCNLIAQGPVAVPVPAQEPVAVYLNGEYWGLYTRREVIEDAIARFEGLENAAGLNVAGANRQAICGDAAGLAEAFHRIKGLDLACAEDLQTLNGLLDTESFLKWMAVNAYLGVPNLYSEVFFYQVAEGPWKCAAGDFAYALFTARDDSVARLINHSLDDDTGMLTAKLLEVPEYRDAFLTRLGALYQALPTPLMQAAVDAESARIADALPAHMERWADAFVQTMSADYNYPPVNAQEALLFQRYRVYRLREKTLVQRPWYVYDGAQQALALSDADMERFFGGTKPALTEVAEDNWADYKAENP